MVQRVTVLASRPLHLSSIPVTHMNEGRQLNNESFLLTCACPHTYILTCICVHMHTHTHIKEITSIIETGLLYSKECLRKGGNESELIFNF